MQSLRDAPGYADMEDYYDSDYVPHHLIDRYNALQQERRKKTEQQFVAATQAHGLAATQDSLALTADSAASLHRTTHASPAPSAIAPALQSQEPSQRPLLRSSLLRSPQRSSSALSSSVPRQGPRTSVALDAIYAAREIGHGFTGASTVSESQRPTPLPSASPNPARPATAAKPAKTRVSRKSAKRSFTSPDEPAAQRDLYGSAAEARRQERFISESKRLGKPFVPPGGSGLDVPTRFMLGDCVKMLYRSIVPDWRAASPMVVSTAEDLIAVYFSLEKLEKARVTALLQYMNAGLLHNAAIREFHLTKVPEGWDVLTDDGYVMYTFRPPWVKKRVFLPDTVNPFHAHLHDSDG